MPNVELPQAEFKVVLLGDTNTGKTSLVLRFVEGYYRETPSRSPTVGAFFFTKRVTLHEAAAGHNSTSCKLLLWDTAGQQNFARLARTYYEQAAAAILTFDVSQPQSLHRLKVILEEVLQNTADRRIIIGICSCKNDLDPDLHAPGLQQEAARLAEQYGAIYVDTSAKTNLGVQSLFEQTAERVWQAHREAVAGSGPYIPVETAANWQKMQRSKSPVAIRTKRSPCSERTGAGLHNKTNMSSPSTSHSGRQFHQHHHHQQQQYPNKNNNNWQSPHHHNHKDGGVCGDSDSTAVDSADDVVIDSEQQHARDPSSPQSMMCDGLGTCVGAEDPSKSCCIS